MWRREVQVTSEQRERLTWMVGHDPKPYRRERAAAILQVADGTAPHAVAQGGLLVRRAPDTVDRWLDRFEEHGVDGLTMPPGRGRQPGHSPPPRPRAPAVERAGLLEILGGDPRAWALPQPQTRWTLQALRAGIPSFWEYSRSSIGQILARHKLRWRRGRDHLHSPDPAYHAKLAWVEHCRDEVVAHPTDAVLRYQDEVTCSRQPSLGYAYAATRSTDPPAERSRRSNTPTRVIATLDAHTGRVVAHQRRRLDVPALVRCYQALVDAYPGRRLYLVRDNWPVHCHPDVLAALEPQTSPFPFLTPPAWSTAPSPTAQRLDLPIQLVPLPPYAPWANPLEKLWRWLKQDVLHLHRLADDLPALRSLVLAFRARFDRDSPDLLRYVGLPGPT